MSALKVSGIKAQCSTLAQDLLVTGAATTDQITAVKPGGSDNPKRDGTAWFRFYGQLQLLRGRAQGSPNGARYDGNQGRPDDDSLTLAALAGAPETITIAGADRAVYPKSLAALLHCHARDLLLGKLATLVARLKDVDANDEHADLILDALGEIDYQNRVLIWIALTEGPGLPFARHEHRPAVPTEMTELAEFSPVDVIQIIRAFTRVNWVNLQALKSLITEDADADGATSARPSFSAFFGSLAIQLHTDPTTLIENRSLVSVMASTALAASAQRAAMNDAKARSEAAAAARAG